MEAMEVTGVKTCGGFMSDTYTKLFSSITESTVWEEPYSTRIAWVTMLAMADASGCVYSSVPGLARRANITRTEVEGAIVSFLSPDRDSRTAANEGRRIEPIDGGWRLLNHAKYAAVRDATERREYWRKWKADKRSAQPEGVDCPQMSTKSTESTPPALTPTPALVNQEQKKKQPPAALPDPPNFVHPEAWAGFVAMRVRERHPLTARAAQLVIAELIKHHASGADPNAILDQSTRNGWRDVFPLRVNGANSHAQPKLSPVEQVRAAAAARRAATG